MGLIFLGYFNLILNILFLKNWNILININNYKIYNSLINNKYKQNYYIFLNYPQMYKYNWCLNRSFFMKFINLNVLNVLNLENFNFKKPSESNQLNDIIFFKKKSSILKKSAEFEFTILNYINRSKEFFFVDHNIHVLENIENFDDKLNHCNTNFSNNFSDRLSSKKYNKAYNFNYKTLDFKRKINQVFKQNRILLRKFLKVKFKRQNTFNRYIKNLTKMSNLSFLYNFEHRLVNLLTRSLFFFNYKDCIWFIKNGYVSVNGLVNFNIKRLLKPFEVVNIIHNDYYFFYYRYMINNCISNLYRFNTKIWKINYQRNNTKKNKNEEKYSNWIYKYIYYKEDIPKFLEVDYISMTVVLLNYAFNKNYIDYYNIKFLNLYLNRLYNWKAII